MTRGRGKHRFSKTKTLAYLRELQSLDITRKQAAWLLHISQCRVSQLMPHTAWTKPLTLLVRIQSYMETHPTALVKEIAETVGTSEGSVVATLWKYGISIKAHRRGFIVPPKLADEYRFLRKTKKLTVREAGEALGLLARGEGGHDGGGSIGP